MHITEPNDPPLENTYLLIPNTHGPELRGPSQTLEDSTIHKKSLENHNQLCISSNRAFSSSPAPLCWRQPFQHLVSLTSTLSIWFAAEQRRSASPVPGTNLRRDDEGVDVADGFKLRRDDDSVDVADGFKLRRDDDSVDVADGFKNRRNDEGVDVADGFKYRRDDEGVDVADGF